MAKIIMIQGTSSGVGKSIFTTALCKIFKEDGYSVAPFKMQNMSSNYHMFENGEKMARSQVISAYACGIEPTPHMNPLLLIPEKDGTEVILNGKSIGKLTHIDYEEKKQAFFNEGLASLKNLCNNYDIVVIEGAGSPVELNLNKNDIVNMGLAKKINVPVLLISDITRGGVFASLYGTLELMDMKEKELVKGLVVNKFIGDINYFYDGIEILEDKCKKDVLGVIPQIDIQVEDEDSLADGIIKTREMLQKNMTDSEYSKFLDIQFSKIAKVFRKNINIKKIYKILEEGVECER